MFESESELTARQAREEREASAAHHRVENARRFDAARADYERERQERERKANAFPWRFALFAGALGVVLILALAAIAWRL